MYFFYFQKSNSKQCSNIENLISTDSSSEPQKSRGWQISFKKSELDKFLNDCQFLYTDSTEKSLIRRKSVKVHANDPDQTADQHKIVAYEQIKAYYKQLMGARLLYATPLQEPSVPEGDILLADHIKQNAEFAYQQAMEILETRGDARLLKKNRQKMGR